MASDPPAQENPLTIEPHADAVETHDPDAPVYDHAGITVYAGDVVAVLSRLPDSSVDAICTDPPYGLEFMGQEWDAPWRSGDVRQPGDEAFTPGSGPYGRAKVRHGGGGAYRGDSVGQLFQAWCRTWTEQCYRVLKPGGHLLAFGGTRMYHRMACAVEDAGFEIRDSIAWVHSQGFPKALDVSKAIDAAAGAKREVVGRRTGRAATPRRDMRGGNYNNGPVPAIDLSEVTAPATEDAKTWSGWHTALKPAHEPIVVARKPLAGTVVGTVLAHGTGALNIDGCRIAHADAADMAASRAKNPGRDAETVTSEVYGADRPQQSVNDAGRWPANVVLDGDQADQLDAQSGWQRDGVASDRSRGFAPDGYVGGTRSDYHGEPQTYGDEGGASRYFLRIADTIDELPARFRYSPKAGQDERPHINGVSHVTVKPLSLVRWMVRLVTPPGGTVLDCFAGSGTTVEACILEGFGCVAVERWAPYLPLIRQRIDRRRDPVAAVRNAKGVDDDASLFDLLGDGS